MKAQMRFQKIMCLVMLIMGALTLLYAFCYCTGGLAELGQNINIRPNGEHDSVFDAAPGKNDATLYDDIQGFNNLLMWFGIVMILVAVLLYVTACHKRRNYYVTNYIAIGICVGVCIVLPLVAIIMNAGWSAEFANVDFDEWYAVVQRNHELFGAELHYSDSMLWFNLGYVVYILMMVAAVLLALNLVWKVLLMRGEKKLLENNLVGGAA